MLLTTPADVEAQVAQLEVHYLSNREGDLRFALVSDWLDAESERVTGDDELLSAAAAGIDQLNQRYGEAPGGGARFLLFHRQRRWNGGEGCWMGWERKRGKLEELNALLRGSTTTSFLTSSTRAASIPPPDVRYVVTLDADTRLPRGSVARLVGTMAHPLNQPRFDSSGRPGDTSATACSSHGSRRRCQRSTRGRRFNASSADLPASIPIRRPSPTSTRISFRRAASPARGSTTSMPSRRRCTGVCRRTHC